MEMSPAFLAGLALALLGVCRTETGDLFRIVFLVLVSYQERRVLLVYSEADRIHWIRCFSKKIKHDQKNMEGDQQDNPVIRHGDSKLVRVIRAVLLDDSNDSDSVKLIDKDDIYDDSGLYHHPEFMPCSDKCHCSLLDAICSLKERILDQARILSEMDSVNGEARCNVKLTNSEERLFGGTIKSDSLVCYILIRELRAQRQDLKDMTNRWVEFINMADRFALKSADIRNRLVADLLPTLESMANRLNDIERSELADEELRQKDHQNYLQRMEERYGTLKKSADRYVEAEEQDHIVRSLRRSKDDQREKERIKDRSALKFVLKRMMHLMGAPKPLEIPPPKKNNQLMQNTACGLLS
ncbi:uncharacterized protein LOC112493616 [Cephus cinctus]|uniref:Uncharacterized protein LOC112493616 n=1 Tax=Cephus cinctus TaxID=211228 RepID=A0AAJ7RCN2_CEPCN|nr:uncharacterized protein LOC112493616 [Cephus cinctus]